MSPDSLWPADGLPDLSEPPVTAVDFAGAEVSMLRLDAVHPLVSGNKLYKLLGHLQAFRRSGRSRLLSFGGAYSNHLHALTALARQLSIPVVLMVRGYEQTPRSPTLEDCESWGGRLIFCDRQSYNRRYDPHWQQQLAEEHDAWVIPEGGAGAEGEVGCQLLAPLVKSYDEVWLATGSGTTALGLARALAARQWSGSLVGVNAVADQGELTRRWSAEMPANFSWRLIDDAHGGAFARITPELRQLIAEWDRRGIPLEPVYTAKMMLAFQRELAGAGLEGKRIMLIHTGGLQGRRGYDLDDVVASGAGDQF